MRGGLSPRGRRTPTGIALILAPALMTLVNAAGCSMPSKASLQSVPALLNGKPPKTTLTAIESSGHPALKSYCTLPVLKEPPQTPFRQVAIVSVSDGTTDDRDTLLTALVGKACPTGADALVMVYDSFNETNTAEGAAQDYQKSPEFIRSATVAERQQVARALASAPRHNALMVIAIVYGAVHPAARKPQP
ncbi:MAG TPA: hypothetical protein VNF45_02675 [Candidatus Binataceae bacterium]|nr:hypothetical protein [Candidatus Binataceae bacterium]